MEKAKLIEKLKNHLYVLDSTNVFMPGKDVWLSKDELDLILTSLTAPVPDAVRLIMSTLNSCLHETAFVLEDDEKDRKDFGFRLTFNEAQEIVNWFRNTYPKLPKTPDAG